MVTVDNMSVLFSGKALFEDVSLKFLPGECYGIIGANGAGKSTFLKVLSGDITPTSGSIHMPAGCRLSMLAQDQFKYDAYTVLDTVIMGHTKLYAIYEERLRLYEKAELTDAEGARIGELEMLFGDLDGYTAEAAAATMLDDLGVTHHDSLMRDLDGSEKVRVLLAQALFGDPEVLLLDEPTNQLDYLSVLWLEKFLMNFKNTVIVVSHDRHFLNTVCTHIADVDFKQIRLYPGNYDFWKQSSELMMQQQQDKNKKDEKKVKELEAFVRRFSANASKSKQATARKKIIEKLRPEALPVSQRRTPFIEFKPFRACGDRVLRVKNLVYSLSGDSKPVLPSMSFTVEPGDKIALIGESSVSKTALLDLIAGVLDPDSGELQWGSTITHGYFPSDNTAYFSDSISLFDWLAQYQTAIDNERIRGFLGRVLFSGDDVNKPVSVLSGGEKARAVFAKLMMAHNNMLLFDEPTNHLDLEAITAVNTALTQFDGVLILTSHDFELLNTVANRVIEVSPTGFIDRRTDFDSYMTDPSIQALRKTRA